MHILTPFLGLHLLGDLRLAYTILSADAKLAAYFIAKQQ
jgi:hypothetical protein